MGFRFTVFTPWKRERWQSARSNVAQHHRLREAQRPAHQSVVRGKRRGAVHLLQVAEKTAGFPGVGTGTAAACVCRVRASSTGVFHFRLRPDRPPHTGRRHRTAGKHAGRSNQRSHSRGPPCWVTSARWSTSIWRADTRICAAGSMVWRRSCSSFLWTRFQTACFCSAEGGATGSKRCCGKVTALCCCTSAWRTGSSGARRTTWSRCGRQCTKSFCDARLCTRTKQWCRCSRRTAGRTRANRTCGCTGPGRTDSCRSSCTSTSRGAAASIRSDF